MNCSNETYHLVWVYLNEWFISPVLTITDQASKDGIRSPSSVYLRYGSVTHLSQYHTAAHICRGLDWTSFHQMELLELFCLMYVYVKIKYNR